MTNASVALIAAMDCLPPLIAARKVIYTTNTIQRVNARLRKIIKTRGHFRSDDAAPKLIWLAL
jgi:transposase-like protein